MKEKLQKKILKKDIYKKERRLKKKLEAQADKLWHTAGKIRWTRICFFDNSLKKGANHQKIAHSCHHYFRKGLYPILRYEIDNAVPLCWSCHYKAEKVDPTMLVDIKEKRGNDWYDRISRIGRANKYSFENAEWYQENINKLSEYIKDNE